MAIIEEDSKKTVPLPSQWNWLLQGFVKYTRWYIHRNFNAIRITKESADFDIANISTIFVTNHPSWWDPLVCGLLTRRYPQFQHFAVIEQAMLEKYWVFQKLGFIGVEKNSVRSALQFVRTAEHLYQRRPTAIWMTAQGEFCDVRQRPIQIKSGPAHLAKRILPLQIVPIGIEYTFWNGKKPEILVHIGEKFDVSVVGTDTKNSTSLIEEQLTATLAILERASLSRNPDRFTRY